MTVSLLTFLTAFYGWTMVAQSQAAPAVATQEGAAHGSSQAPARAVPTLRALSRLVVVDVVVTDEHQRAIHGLKQSDFVLTEGRAVQTVKNFEEHRGLPAAVTVEKMPKLPPGVFTNFTPAPINSALNVLLLDTLNTPTKDQAYVRSQLLEYLKNAKAGTSIAIFGLTTRLNMLQGFTSDPEILKAAVAKKPYRPSPLLDDPSGGQGLQDSLSDQLTTIGRVPPDVLSSLQNFEAEQKSVQLQLRTKYTLDAMNVLAHYLAGLPGRKNLIWFSGSFPLNLLPDAETTGNPFAGVMSSDAEFRETTNLLASSQVAVYPIDARGLMVAPMFDVATQRAGYTRGPTAFAGDSQKFNQAQTDEHSTMRQMAEATGGKAFVNTNGLSEAVASAIDAGSDYYTLAYSPSKTDWKGEYRRIEVRLQQKGYTLAYRRGYFADDPDRPQGATGAVTPPEMLRTALMHGAPGATQIIFTTRVLPVSTVLEDKPADGNRVNAGDGRSKGPYRSYTVAYAADPRGMSFVTAADGSSHGSIDFMVLVYDAAGTLVVEQSNEVAASLPPGRLAAMVHGGLQYQQKISVPAKGEYSLRVAVRDRIGNKLGSVEMPVAAVKNLAPAMTQAAPSGAVPVAGDGAAAAPK